MNSITPWDRTRFEKKSSRELLELLRRDSQANSRQELDEEEILYILELLRSRGDLPETGDSREAWKSFVKNYLPQDGDGGSIYGDEVKPGREHRRGWVFRTVVAAAAAVMVAIGGVAYVAGQEPELSVLDLGSRLIIGVDPENKIPRPLPRQLRVLYRANLAHGLLPYWLPEGLERTDYKRDEGHLAVTLSGGGHELTLEYVTPAGKLPSGRSYTGAQGREFTLVDLAEGYRVSWTEGETAAVLETNLDYEQLLGILDSVGVDKWSKK